MFILFASLFLIPQSFAQQGCCINPDLGSNFLCKQSTQSQCNPNNAYALWSGLDFIHTGQYGFYQDQACSAVTSNTCEEVCFVCVSPGTKAPTKNIWNIQALGCDTEFTGLVKDTIDNSLTTKASCEGTTSPASVNLPNVTGTVTDQGTGVSGAVVTCSGSSTTTGTGGTYRLVGCSTGSQSIAATLGSKAGSVSATLIAGTQTTVNIPITQIGSGTLLVNVKDITNQPIQGANVVINAVSYSQQKTTDTTGSAQFISIPSGQLVITSGKSGFTTNTTTINSLPSSGTLTVILIPSAAPSTVPSSAVQPPSTGPFDIIVQDETGKAVQSASVRVFPSAGTVLSDNTGKTTFQLVNGQTYTVIINHPDFKYYQQDVQMDLAVKSFTAHLTPLPEITITGTILNSTLPRRTVKDATITAIGTSVLSGSNGQFTLKKKIDLDTVSKLPISIVASGYNTESRVITLNPSTFTYPLGDIVLSTSACDSPDDLGISLSAVLNNGKINLGWQGSCSPLQFKIKKRIGDATQTILVSSDTSAYVDSSILGDTEYCYIVEGDYPLGSIYGVYQQSSSEVCITTGSDRCFQGDKTFCDGNTKVECKGGAETQTLCQGSDICHEDGTTASCTAVPNCDLCNRPFGVFSNIVSQSSSSALFGGKGFNTSISAFNPNTVQTFYCSQQAVLCYLDRSKTVVDKYASCQNIHSCYDYLSQTACEGSGFNKNKCLPQEDCQWVSSQSYGDVGVGVCRPTDVQKQDCRAFESRNPNSNAVFASTKEVCQLYGASCYFTGTKCLNAGEVSCYDYATQKDCTGQTDQNVTVDVTWSVLPTPGVKTYFKSAGSNRIITRSLDVFNTGICKFITDSCVRDADDNQEGYSLSGRIMPDNGKDCVPTDPEFNLCAQDKTPPRTLVSLQNNSRVSAVDFGYAVEDNSASDSPLTTWFNARPIVTTGNPVSTYPDQKFVSFGASDLHFHCTNCLLSNASGTPYKVFYFSEDRSHNLEEVQSINVVVDAAPPILDFSYEVIPDLRDNSVTFIPSLKMNISTGDTAGYCVQDPDATGLFLVQGSGEIRLKSHPADSPLGTVLRDSWTETYTDVGTGSSGITVDYHWKCYDEAGNVNSGSSGMLRLDADGTIDDPQPAKAVKERTAIPISIKTLYAGECRYSDNFIANPSDYASATPFQTADGTFHTSSVDVPTGNNKRFYVACNLTTLHGIFYGTESDEIRITVDDVAPQTIPYLSGKPLAVWPDWVTANSQLELHCVDVDQNIGNFPGESECGKVYYCLGDGTCDLATDNTAIVSPVIERSSRLIFRSEDNYGNNESVQFRDLKVDNEKPQISLNAPLNTVAFDTKDRSVLLSGVIRNLGFEDCVRGPGCDVSPIDSAYYELRSVAGQLITNGTIPITVTENQLTGEIAIPEQRIPIRLNNKTYLSMYVKDKAGNVGQTDLISIVQDVEGPSLESFSGESIPIGNEGASLYPNIEAGRDFKFQVRNVLDKYPLSTVDLKSRVDTVWIEDVFGVRYQLTRSPSDSGLWETTIRTSTWPVTTSQFRTFVTVFANDSLGNKAQKEVNLFVKDNTPPTAIVKIENKYSTKTNTLIKGMNYIVLNASESLENVTLGFMINQNEYNVTFVLRDFDAQTWTGFVDIPENLVGTATVTGSMYDSNGVLSLSSGFIVDPLVSFASQDLGVPTPLGNLVDGVYYINQQDVNYAGLQPTYEYQFTVNDKITSISGILNDVTNYIVPGFTSGLNEVSIRREDALGNYDVTTQKIFINTTLSSQPENSSLQRAISPELNRQTSYNGFTDFNGVFVSRNQAVTLGGSKEPGISVYVIGQDRKVYLSTTSVGSDTFDIPAISLVGYTFTETPNTLTLVFEDDGGNRLEKTINILKDLRPPQLISLQFARQFS